MISKQLLSRLLFSNLLLSVLLHGASMAAKSSNLEAKPTIDTAVSNLVELLPGVYDVPIVLSQSLEGRREEFRQDMIKAQARLRVFANRNGWQKLTDAPFIKQVEIYDTKDGWDNRMRQFYATDAPAEIPKTFSAAIEKEVFFSVSPEVYFANYPDGRLEPDAFIKLMTHELAHRLHVRICKGDEERMGPIWFFEGFAIYAADQLNLNKPKLTEADIWSIVDAKERGSYKKYNVVFRHFLRGMSLPEYVEKAGEQHFTEWLKTRTLVKDN
jgi:hypothetical protein